MGEGYPDRPGVVAIPPLIYLVGFGIGWLIDLGWPMPLLPATLSPWLGAILIVGGIAIVVSAIRAFRQARTPVDVRKPTTAIVTHGVFQWSRNPMYLSLTLLYLGLALLLNSLWIVLMAVPVLGVVRWGVIAREELYLERKFGEEYLRYKAKVRRWL